MSEPSAAIRSMAKEAGDYVAQLLETLDRLSKATQALVEYNQHLRDEITDRAGVEADLRAQLARLWPHYTSTYCIHSHHEDCRETCKTCDNPCLCDCHKALL